jgi:hypothetical protein
MSPTTYQNQDLKVSLESSRQVLLKKMLACAFPFLKLKLCRKYARISWQRTLHNMFLLKQVMSSDLHRKGCICTTLVRLANFFVPHLFQIMSLVLKIGISFDMKGNVVQTRSLASKRNRVRYVKRNNITWVKARYVILIIEQGATRPTGA